MLNTTTTLTTGLALTLALTACDTTEPGAQREKALLEGPNPAAVFCAEHEGTYDEMSGECRLSDGTPVNAWQYFREQHQANLQVGKPNPAAVFCAEHGTYSLQDGSCELEDGTVVDAWDYFREHHQDNASTTD